MASGYQFVFVSHAHADKPAIRFIVEALIAAGLKVWLDKPEQMGFPAAYREAHFVDLNLKPGEGSLKSQIYLAIEASACVVACCSKSFLERYGAAPAGASGDSAIKQEVIAGKSKLVVCRIDDAALDGIPGILEEEMIQDLHGDAGNPLSPAAREDSLKALVSAVARKIGQVQQRRGSDMRRGRDDFPLYMINRKNQEAAASRAIEKAAAGGVHAMFVQGPRNECLDKFRERLTRETSRKCMGGERSWQEVLVDWPAGDVKGFDEAYERGLANAFRLRRDESEIVKELSKQRHAPVAVMSVIDMSEWGRGQRERMIAWLRYWRRISKLSSDIRVAPVLAVELPPVPAGWKKFPPARSNGLTAKQIWSDVEFAMKRTRKDRTLAPLDHLDALHPVTEADARHWMRATLPVLSTPDEEIRRFEAQISKVFRSGGKKLKQVALADFAEGMRPLYVSSGGGQT